MTIVSFSLIDWLKWICSSTPWKVKQNMFWSQEIMFDFQCTSNVKYVNIFKNPKSLWLGYFIDWVWQKAMRQNVVKPEMINPRIVYERFSCVVMLFVSCLTYDFNDVHTMLIPIITADKKLTRIWEINSGRTFIITDFDTDLNKTSLPNFWVSIIFIDVWLGLLSSICVTINFHKLILMILNLQIFIY